jgi:hypothetical protein
MRCFSTINETGLHEILVGIEFMKNFYTVFDLDHDAVGLAASSASEKVRALNKGK